MGEQEERGPRQSCEKHEHYWSCGERGFYKGDLREHSKSLEGGPKQLLKKGNIHTWATAWVKHKEYRILVARWSVTLASGLGQSPSVKQ